MLEEYEYPEPSRKRVYVLLLFLVLLAGTAIVVAFRTTGFKGVFVASGKHADANSAVHARGAEQAPGCSERAGLRAKRTQRQAAFASNP
jgi:hypothetical protein